MRPVTRRSTGHGVVWQRVKGHCNLSKRFKMCKLACVTCVMLVQNPAFCTQITGRPPNNLFIVELTDGWTMMDWIERWHCPLAVRNMNWKTLFSGLLSLSFSNFLLFWCHQISIYGLTFYRIKIPHSKSNVDADKVSAVHWNYTRPSSAASFRAHNIFVYCS